jgi:hypothetical protein
MWLVQDGYKVQIEAVVMFLTNFGAHMSVLFSLSKCSFLCLLNGHIDPPSILIVEFRMVIIFWVHSSICGFYTHSGFYFWSHTKSHTTQIWVSDWKNLTALGLPTLVMNNMRDDLWLDQAFGCNKLEFIDSHDNVIVGEVINSCPRLGTMNRKNCPLVTNQPVEVEKY